MANSKKYPIVSRFLHWLIAFSVLGAYVAIWTGNYPLHFLLGTIALVGSVIRLVTMHIYLRKVPAIHPPLSPFTALTAKLTKYGLALAFIVVPLLAIFGRGLAFGRGLSFYGIEVLAPGFVEKNEQLGKLLFSLHEPVAYAALALIAAHSVAALFHHYVRKDNTLSRML